MGLSLLTVLSIALFFFVIYLLLIKYAHDSIFTKYNLKGSKGHPTRILMYDVKEKTCVSHSDI